MNPSASSGINRQEYPTGPPTGGPSNSDDGISLCCTLCDVQRQLITMQEQNFEHENF